HLFNGDRVTIGVEKDETGIGGDLRSSICKVYLDQTIPERFIHDRNDLKAIASRATASAHGEFMFGLWRAVEDIRAHEVYHVVAGGKGADLDDLRVRHQYIKPDPGSCGRDRDVHGVAFDHVLHILNEGGSAAEIAMHVDLDLIGYDGRCRHYIDRSDVEKCLRACED